AAPGAPLATRHAACFPRRRWLLALCCFQLRLQGRHSRPARGVLSPAPFVARPLLLSGAAVWGPSLTPYPTDPSRLTLNSFCASTANSIGSSRKNSLQTPLPMLLDASSGHTPRW